MCARTEEFSNDPNGYGPTTFRCAPGQENFLGLYVQANESGGGHSARTGVKRSKHEADHSTTIIFEVKNTRSLNVPTKRQSYFHVPLLKEHGNHYIVC